MKKLLLIILIFITSCKTANTIQTKTTKNQELVWTKLGANTSYVDILNKFTTRTENYWFGNSRISSIWADPNNADHLLAGIGFSDVYETKDNGNSWQNITKNIPVIDVKKIIKKDGIFYISTGYRYKNPTRFSAKENKFYGYGVLYSKDDGKTWSKPSGDFYCADFAISKDHKISYAIGFKNVYKSTDSVNHFKKIFSFKYKIPYSGELISVVTNPLKPNLVYVSSANGNKKSDATLFFSSDGGKTFTNKTAIYKQFAPKALSNLGFFIKDVSLFYDEKESTLYAHFSVANRFVGRNKKEYFKASHLILKSTDFVHFTIEHQQSKNSGYHFIPFIKKIDSTFFLEDWYLKMKNPSDKLFKDIGTGKVHQDTRSVAVTKRGTIYYGNDAGLYKSDDNGATWQNVFPNLNANLIIEASYYSDTEKRRIAIGTQDCGYYLNDFNGKPKYPIAIHEGGIYQSPHNINRIYLKDRYVSVSNDGGKTFKNIIMNDGKPLKIMHSDGALTEDPIQGNKLYASHYNGLFVSDSLGKKGTWKNITPKNKLNGRGSCLAISKTNPSVLFFANELVTTNKAGSLNKYNFKAHLVKSIDGGKTWTNIVKELDWLLKEKSNISTVIVSDNNPDYVWFTLRNKVKGEKVYFSKDGGNTWQNISYNLPNVPANRIVYDSKNNQLYVGNDLGIYRLENDVWKEYGSNLPKIIITSMFVDTIYNELIVSTFGQGIWRIPLKN